MVHEEHDGGVGPQRGEQGHLVEVLDHDIEPAVRQAAPVVEGGGQPEAVPASRPMDFEAAQPGRAGSLWPPRAQERDRVAPLRQPPEDLEEVDLGASGLGIFGIEPVQDEDVQGSGPDSADDPLSPTARL